MESESNLRRNWIRQRTIDSHFYNEEGLCSCGTRIALDHQGGETWLSHNMKILDDFDKLMEERDSIVEEMKMKLDSPDIEVNFPRTCVSRSIAVKLIEDTHCKNEEVILNFRGTVKINEDFVKALVYASEKNSLVYTIKEPSEVISEDFRKLLLS